jgi:sugar lactone lactonase YvrE
VTVRPEIRRIGDIKNQLGEGPLWDVAEQAFYWLDIVGKTLDRWTPASDEHRTWPLPASPGSLVLREVGGAVIALERIFVTSIGVQLAGRDAGEPDAGALLAVEGLGIKGLPEPRFRS